MTTPNEFGDDGPLFQGPAPMTRRRILGTAGAAALAISTSGFLAACGGDDDDSTQQSSPDASTGKPSPGGTLRVGMTGNGEGETYNPALIATPIDALHGYSVFDPLIRPAPNYKTEPGLAMSWEHNDDATVWEIKLREGVTWHDGKPFTADDVIYTFRLMGDPAHFGHPAVVNVRLNELKALNDHTLQVPLKLPIARLEDYFLYFNSSLIVQDGATDFSQPVGTGPYKLDSFTPGKRSELSANRDYWDSPKPYPDQLEIVSIDDDTARLNALQGGQIDICSPMSYAQAKNGGNSRFVPLIGDGGSNIAFYMRVDQAPFNDERVRQAMRLLVDREALIESVYSGYGTVGNDLFGKGLPFYASDLPQRTQDVEQAKSLLKSAGAADLRFTLQTSPVAAGFVEAATAFSQQCKEAGVTVEVKREQPASYFNPTLLYLKMPFAQTIWPVSSLPSIYSSALVSGAPTNETHYSDKTFDDLFLQAQAATNEEEATELWGQVQKIQYDSGAYINWANAQSVAGIAPTVRGIGGPGSGWLQNLDDFRVWNWGLVA